MKGNSKKNVPKGELLWKKPNRTIPGSRFRGKLSIQAGSSKIFQFHQTPKLLSDFLHQVLYLETFSNHNLTERDNSEGKMVKGKVPKKGNHPMIKRAKPNCQEEVANGRILRGNVQEGIPINKSIRRNSTGGIPVGCVCVSRHAGPENCEPLFVPWKQNETGTFGPAHAFRSWEKSSRSSEVRRIRS